MLSQFCPIKAEEHNVVKSKVKTGWKEEVTVTPINIHEKDHLS